MTRRQHHRTRRILTSGPLCLPFAYPFHGGDPFAPALAERRSPFLAVCRCSVSVLAADVLAAPLKPSRCCARCRALRYAQRQHWRHHACTTRRWQLAPCLPGATRSLAALACAGFAPRSLTACDATGLRRLRPRRTQRPPVAPRPPRCLARQHAPTPTRSRTRCWTNTGEDTPICASRSRSAATCAARTACPPTACSSRPASSCSLRRRRVAPRRTPHLLAPPRG